MLFHGFDVTVQIREYKHGGKAIILVDQDGSPVATATVCVPSDKLDNDQCLVKDWSENEGMLDFLIDNNIVSEPIRTVQVGFCDAYLVNILIE